MLVPGHCMLNNGHYMLRTWTLHVCVLETLKDYPYCVLFNLDTQDSDDVLRGMLSVSSAAAYLNPQTHKHKFPDTSSYKYAKVCHTLCV